MKSILPICLMFAVGCTNNEELRSLKSALRITGEKIIAKQDESLSILKENTTELAAIKSQIDTLSASQAESETGNRIGGDLESIGAAPDKNANDSHLATMVVAESGAVPIFVTSSASCVPCQTLWKDVEAGKFVGFDVRKSADFEGLTSYPAIRFQSAKSPTGWVVRYGYDATQLEWLRANLLTESTVAASPVMSQNDMIALHNSLHGGGRWSWPGDLETHLRTTHGVMSGGEPVTGSFFPVQRSNSFVSARSSVRPVSRGSSFSWRARTVSR